MVVVVYKKSNKGKRYIKVFQNEDIPDRILNLNARKPLINNEYSIEEIGVGESFINYYKSKFKIKGHEVA